jgi:hypothetical protein
MLQPRAELAGLLRPRLKPPGFNDSAFLREFDRILDVGGMRRDAEAPPEHRPTTAEAPPGPPMEVIPRGLTDPTAFFASLRSTGLFPAIIQPQVDGINFKLAAFGRAGWPISFAAYGFATSYWETGHKMQPVREKGSGDGPDADPWDDYLERYDTGPLAIRLGNTPEADGDGVATAGKGDVQLTGVANYRRATVELRKLGVIGPDLDLLKTPELVLRPDISAAIMVLGMEQGWFTGRKLAHTLPTDRPATLAEFVVSRPIINGRDKDDEIGAIAIDWQTALQAGGWG